MLREKLERIVFYLLLLFLPTQFGKHFWPDFAIISGIRVDYLSPTLYVTDIIIFLLFIFWSVRLIQSLKFKMQSYNANFKILNFKLFFDKLRILSLPSGQLLSFNFAFLILLLLFLLLNIYISQNYVNGLYHLLKLLEFSFVAYYVSCTMNTIAQLKKLFLFLGIGVIWQSLLAIGHFINQGSFGGAFYLFGERSFTAATPGIANVSVYGELLLRPYGTFSHPNVLAGFLLVSMIGLVFTLPWTKKFEKTVWIAAILFGSSALLLTMSRVSIVLWACLLLILFLITSLRALAKRSMAIPYGIASSFFFAMTIIFVVSGLLFTPFGSRIFQTSLSEESFVQRVELTRTSIDLTATQPVVGVGFGNFLPMLATVASPLPPNLYLQPVHNIFLLVLAETGIIGLGILIWFLVKTYKRLFGLVKKEEAFPYRLFVVLLSIVLVLGSFDHYLLTLQQGQLLFAFILGLSWTQLRG